MSPQDAEAELEAALSARAGETEASTAGGADEIVSAMRTFLGGSSDYTGVEPKYHSSSDETDSDDGREVAGAPTARSCRVVLDPDAFMRILSGDYGTVSTTAGATVGRRETAGDGDADSDGAESDMMDSSCDGSVGEDPQDEATVEDYMVRASCCVNCVCICDFLAICVTCACGLCVGRLPWTRSCVAVRLAKGL